MAVLIDEILFTDDFTGVPSGNGSDTGVPYLMGCVGDLIYATIKFRVSWSVRNSILNFDSASQTITLKSCGTPVSFTSFIQEGFQIGDTIIISGTNGNDGTYTIKDLTGITITTNEAIAVSDVFDNTNIFGVTKVNFFDFYYNLDAKRTNTGAILGGTGGGVLGRGIELNKRVIGQKHFISLTEPKALQKFTGTDTGYSYGQNFTLEPNSTSHAWWNNKIDGVDSKPVITDYDYNSNHEQIFTLVFPFLITPLFLAEQLQLLQNAYKKPQQSSELNSQNGFAVPSYFDNTSLGFICRLDCRFKVTSATPDHSSELTSSFNDGNTTWFDTFFPTGVYIGGQLLTKQQFNFKSITYTDNSSNVLSSIDVKTETNVEIIINRSGTLALDTCKFVVNFIWLPTDVGAYSGYSEQNQVDFREVFLHDRCKTNVGAAAKNGDQFGTSLQAINSCTGTPINATSFKVNFKINLGSLSESTFAGDFGKNYMIWITPQSIASTKLETSTRSAVICDVNQAFLNTDDSSLLTIVTDGTSDVHFFKYSDTSANPFTNIKDWSGEYLLSKCQFIVKKECIIENIRVQIGVELTSTNPAKPISTNTFIIEQWSNATESFYDGTINQIDVNQSRNFDLPLGDIYNTRSINRESSLDDVTHYGYTLLYGFQFGYKFWQQLQNVSEQFIQYQSDYWAVFTQRFAGNNPIILPPGFSSQIKFLIFWDVKDITTGITTTFSSTSNLFVYDEGTIIGSNEGYIQTQDLIGNDLNGQVPVTSQTRITGYFMGDSLVAPGGYTAIGELIAYYNNGTNTIYDRIKTDDGGIELSESIWESVPELIYNVGDTEAVVTGVLNSVGKNIKNISIYSKIIFKKN